MAYRCTDWDPSALISREGTHADEPPTVPRTHSSTQSMSRLFKLPRVRADTECGGSLLVAAASTCIRDRIPGPCMVDVSITSHSDVLQMPFGRHLLSRPTTTSSVGDSQQPHRAALRRAVVGAAALTAIVCGVAAQAGAQTTATPVTFTFYGRGNGHGIGMSQWGAEGAALQGLSAAQIMAFYFHGTTVSTVPTTTIRVQLAGYAAQFGIGVSGTGHLVDVATGAQFPLSSGVNYTVRPSTTGAVVTNPAGTVIDRSTGAIQVVPTGTGLAEFNGAPYRGLLTVSPSGGTISAINTVGLESYLRGVVPSEMPSSWVPAALQAQAIAARSYALRSVHPTASFDVYSDTRSQEYLGVNAEAATTDAAVSATAGKAVTYNGTVVQTFFAASDGGQTENIENVWGGTPQPYYVSVVDPYDAIAPSHLWQSPPQFTGTQLGSLLGTGGVVTSVNVVKRGVSPRVMLADVTLQSGAVIPMTGSDIEACLGLSSTWFWVGQSNLALPTEPAGGAPVPTTVKVVAHPIPGSYMLLVAKSSSRAWANRVAQRVRRVAPGAQVVSRSANGRRAYLVIALRTNSRGAATNGQIALRKWGWQTTLIRALRSDPAPRPSSIETIAAFVTPPAVVAPSLVPGTPSVASGAAPPPK